MKKIFMFAALAMMSMTVSAQKFAHVNLNELVQLMPEMDDARLKIDAASREAGDAYQEMVNEFNTKYQAYQQKVSTWSQATRETKEKELTDIQQRIQEFQQTVQAELQQQQQTLMAPIYKKAQDTVEQLGREGGYVYVFDVNAALYIDPAQSTDITAAARKILGISDDRTLEALQRELQAQAAMAE
ncbi:MAG: OmpH family outer membrane protein [Bacteroidales bacterium]|nr:OmpH family outer membrane protein [Bacteroidales bacterium]